MDSGVGIKQEEQSKLFTLFGKLSSSSELNTQGVGLGLSITKMISREFDGDVALLSQPDHGSIFLSSLQIPRELAPERFSSLKGGLVHRTTQRAYKNMIAKAK